MDVVFLGDSLLAWNPRTDVHNFAVPGYTTTELLFQIQKINFKDFEDSEAFENKSCFLLCGVNDLMSPYSEKYIYDNYRELIPLLEEKFKKLFIISLLPTSYSSLNEKIKNVNYFLKENYSLNFIDIYREFLANDEKLIENIYTVDGIHLSNLAYDILNQKIDEALNNY